MNTLVSIVAERANIPEMAAKVAVDTVIDYIRGKLPSGVVHYLDLILQSGTHEAETQRVGQPHPHGFVQTFLDKMSDRAEGASTPTDEMIKERESQKNIFDRALGGWA
eukprot:CAMPEP_0196655984 /NCGR_PEP_ID=MMETSP1086-20130531/11831_1 /TAXON_ID=77921 /ORGANISM="Cyanoptyche  gloeocystis , Strain SAG4.97" /LENGTH=107 /DNA_ID=CAMNT_0041988553 /DNA_START=111 /DNA_END=434 /DNA_ORIENTATION=+